MDFWPQKIIQFPRRAAPPFMAVWLGPFAPIMPPVKKKQKSSQEGGQQAGRNGVGEAERGAVQEMRGAQVRWGAASERAAARWRSSQRP